MKKTVTINPMLELHGVGPDALCATCAYLRLKEVFQGGRFFKCAERGTYGRETDHKPSWRACSRYEEA